MFIKLGEIVEISRIENSESCIPAVSQEVLDNFRKTANSLKKIAPKAEDFLYFSAVMMHAAEASSINEDGTPRLTARGEPVKVSWDKAGGTWKWSTNDPNVKPYKNSNGDIFPEEELVKAYKKWVHKPLCIDHKSSSVDHVRGFIVDTYYDRNLKRVIALCALDKHNYPDLARKVSTGYSNSVSMGTAVGKAICSDCARVAKAENDFCDHMRNKTCYGEINIDLNPIELSIVVNGADPRAHIKHIIAAANTLNNYVENKSEELNDLAEKRFSANFNFSDLDGPVEGSANFSVNTTNFKDFIVKVEEKLNNIKELYRKSVKDSEMVDSEDLLDSNESSDSTVLAPPYERYASSREEGVDSIQELRQITSSIETKLKIMKNNLERLANNSINTQEENMSGLKGMNKRGYYQGSGGVNEPTPGQSKYDVDPINDKLRTDGDKHMLGDVDTGPVDGLHPGVESSGMSELERKKMLARAEAEERAIRRSAIVNLAKKALEDKRAYFQGGGGVNEPTPGKTKYPADRLQDDLREDSDKHMVGQKPFPGVGAVDKLHPSPGSADNADELKRKQMLSRAGLKAKFVKVANSDGTHNLGKSGWEVFVGDKLVLSASVNQLSGNKAGLMYDSIATRDFGSKLIEKVKAYGPDGVRTLIRNAQAAPAAPPPPAPAAPAAPAEAPPADMPSGDFPPPPEGGDTDVPDVEDTGKSGDTKETAVELAEKVRDLSSDLVEAVRALTSEKSEIKEMEEKEEEKEAEQPAETAKSASNFSLSTLNSLRKELNGALIKSMKEAVAELNDHDKELRMIAGMYNSRSINAHNARLANSIVKEAFSETRASISDSLKLMSAFVKYARGTQAIVKRAQMEEEEALRSANFEDLGIFSADDSNYSMSSKKKMHGKKKVIEDMDESDFDDMLSDNDEDYSMYSDDDSSDSQYAMSSKKSKKSMHSSDSNDSDSDLYSDFDENDADGEIVARTPQEAAQISKENPNAKVTMAYLNTKAGRSALRAKIAAKALGKQDNGEVHDMSRPHFSDMLEQSHSATSKQSLPDFGQVETVEEINSAMMDLATAPVKVRKEAEAIHKLVSEGKLDVSDLNALVAEGLDKDAVAYYKKYFGQVDGGSEFASELVKEHVKAELESDLNSFRIKMARAYELAYDMVDRGLCAGDRSAISSQVDEIMKFNDESFNSLKRVVAKHAPILKKEAGRMPQVGLIGANESNTYNTVQDDWSLLEAALAKSPRRMF